MFQLNSWRASTKWTIVLAALGITTGLLFSAITASPYLYDDLLNKDIRQVSAREGLTLLDQIISYTMGWMGAEGRFFPGSLGWSFSVFWIFNSLLSYKLIVATVVALSIAVFSGLVGKLLQSVQAALLTWFNLLMLCEIRFWFDGITSFAALVPLTILLVSLSLIVAISSAKWWAITISGILFLLPLITYEVVILFAPVVVLAVYFKTKSLFRTLGIGIASITIGALSLILRANLRENSPSSAYLVSLSPIKIGETFIEQLLAAIPFSQWILAGEYPSAHIFKFAVIILFLAFVPTSLALYFLMSSGKLVDKRYLLGALLAGAWIWVSSAALVSVSGRWQNELSMGQGYLSVIYEYFGLSLVVTAVTLFFTQRIKTSKMSQYTQKCFIMTLASFTSLLICLALSANFVVVNA